MPDDFQIVVAENRRLLKEVRQLRARVAALESSRWWRLHPRFALRRWGLLHAARSEGFENGRTTPDADSPPTALDPITERFRAEVVARGRFHLDQFTGNIPSWEPLLGDLEGKEARILEIGSLEGMSACYFLWRLPDARITCIDTFAGSSSFAAWGVDVSELEAAFDHNIALVDSSRACKLVGDSAHRLLELLGRKERFDLVFVDGSELALDVMVDACLSWQLLAPGGLMIFDNYIWRSPLGEDRLLRPKPAVDAFLDLIRDDCER